MITIAALVLSIKLGAVFQRLHAPDPQALCGIETTSYRFVGAPGTPFIYDGDQFVVPAEGSIELIAARTASYILAGRSLPANVEAPDEFGRRTIRLPINSTEASAELTTPQTPLPAVRRLQ